MTTVLVVDDEENIRKILGAILTAHGYEVLTAPDLETARTHLKTGKVEVVLSDLRLKHEDGLMLLRWIKDEGLPCPVIILTAHATVDSAVDAMKQGAFDYVSKPFEQVDLLRVLEKAALTYRYQTYHQIRTIGTPSAFAMIGQNERMRKIYQMIDRVAGTDTTVLITGESGTGKELIAQSLHERSTRNQGPFIKINCAAIPETLMESELFGHEKGAFTGAASSKPGRFELADGGTLFLDEIGEMTPEMQAKLLRVLQDRTFERVGGIRTLRADVRLIAATNQDLDSRVKSKAFRQDLFYRLNVLPIHLPPLRERLDDIPRLISYFLNKFSEQMKRPVPTPNPETLELLCQFPWPGNIRQLENVIERVLIMNDSETLTPDALPEEIIEYEEERFALGQSSSGSLKDIVKDATRRIERKAIEEALSETSQNVTRAARKLNISRKGLQIKMKELGLR